MKILVNGSTGELGSALVNQLMETNYNVRLTTRTKPENLGEFDWIRSDFLTGEGIEEAANGIDVIIHAATSPLKRSELIDVDKFGEFINNLPHIKHFIYPSIVGIEHIPLKYYKNKCKAKSYYGIVLFHIPLFGQPSFIAL